MGKRRVALLDQCRKEDSEMENRIKPVEDKYAKLAEFEVIPPDEELNRKAQLRPEMERFKLTLSEADRELGKHKKVMKAGLETELQSFASSIKDVKSTFAKGAPYRSEGRTVEQAKAILQDFAEQ